VHPSLIPYLSTHLSISWESRSFLLPLRLKCVCNAFLLNIHCVAALLLCRRTGLSLALCRNAGLSLALCRNAGLSLALCRNAGLSLALCRNAGLSLALCRRALARSVSQRRALARSVSQRRALARAVSQRRALARAVSQRRALARAVSQRRALARAVSQRRALARAVSQRRALARAVSQRRALARAVSQRRALARAVSPRSCQFFFYPSVLSLCAGNGTLNKQAGIDYTQLTRSHKLNENHSGELWKGRWQGNDIIIKLLKIRDWSTRKSRDFNEEYPKLRIFSHPNVLPVLGACQSPPAPQPILITHWMPYGSLYNVLHEGTNLVVDQCQAVKFALDIARGMAFLHTLEPLIPRHYLNSRSVMIDEDMTARISMADVKFSFQCPGRMYCPAWVAPEALQKRPEDINRRSADMWSFAVLLWELVTREVPFADLSNMEIGMKVSLEGLRPTIPPGISPHICKLMKICMNEDPAKRPKFDMIVPILEKMQEK
uniref:Scaffold protein ILK n=2 Tax=Anura TaxID=8342 RepID=A0A8C5MNT6_9ANUR